MIWKIVGAFDLYYLYYHPGRWGGSRCWAASTFGPDRIEDEFLGVDLGDRRREARLSRVAGAALCGAWGEYLRGVRRVG
jgi:hypothetical protein